MQARITLQNIVKLAHAAYAEKDKQLLIGQQKLTSLTQLLTLETDDEIANKIKSESKKPEYHESSSSMQILKKTFQVLKICAEAHLCQAFINENEKINAILSIENEVIDFEKNYKQKETKATNKSWNIDYVLFSITSQFDYSIDFYKKYQTFIEAAKKFILEQPLAIRHEISKNSEVVSLALKDELTKKQEECDMLKSLLQIEYKKNEALQLENEKLKNKENNPTSTIDAPLLSMFSIPEC